MLLRALVKPNSKTNSISIDDTGIVRIKIHAPPIDGEANKHLVEYLAELFNLPKSKIEITKGHNSPHKTIKLNAAEDYIKSILNPFKN
ncbi:MAG: DUF167 domain-containing protein [Bacteroidia bacterium]